MPTDIKTYADVKDSKWPGPKKIAEAMEAVSESIKHPPGMNALLKQREEILEKIEPLQKQVAELTEKIKSMCKHRPADLQYTDNNYDQEWERWWVHNERIHCTFCSKELWKNSYTTGW